MNKILSTIVLAAVGAAAAFAATPASFPGGAEAQAAYISENLKYPETAKASGIEGVVQVSFAVLPDGKIGSIKIDRMIDPDLESEAVRLVKLMPAWTPATDDAGKPVQSTVTLKIPFTLD
ncbi:MAG: energy transducer TonB [Muribaculaceae bacterium]|nr:energy transducer TonB [Muribaculaceae bacterium]